MRFASRRVLDLLVAILHAEGRLGPAAAAAAPVTPDGPARAGPRARAVLLRCGLVDLVRGVLREAVRLQAGEVRAGVGRTVEGRRVARELVQCVSGRWYAEERPESR